MKTNKISNQKSQLTTHKLTLNTRNAGTLEPWNIATLKPSVRRKEIPFVTYLSALHSKPNALRYTLYALRWNFETLEHWNPGTLEPWNLGTLEPH